MKIGFYVAAAIQPSYYAVRVFDREYVYRMYIFIHLVYFYFLFKNLGIIRWQQRICGQLQKPI